MSIMLGLRVLAVILLGWVVALAARRVLLSVAGHERVGPRDLIGEVLTGLGAGVMGWALLPAGAVPSGDALFLGGMLLWIVGALVQPRGRPSGTERNI